MEKEFINYEEALALKELGFDEPCLGYYIDIEIRKPLLVTTKISDTQHGYFTFAPLYQQAFRLLREKHERFNSIWMDGNNTWTFRVYTNSEQIFFTNKSFKTYEEAELECLKKLIEIVKNDNKAN